MTARRPAAGWPNASSTSREEPSARAHRFAASSRSARRPSASRNCSASLARFTASLVSVRKRSISQPTISAIITSIPSWSVMFS